ncbi:uncharacterized protein LOC141714409 [Apium graveolens]|uniref:uncharacterized protein LOC141714409 n=1 Tax=Apium graveolens TaxID=4045 RepID=UPI003D7BA800
MKSSKTETSKTKDRVGLSYPMLARSKYTTWALKMKVNMQAHGVWDTVDPKDSNSNIEEKMDKTALAKAKVQTLKSEFESLKMKETEQLDDLCYKLNSLVANIRALGEPIDEGYVVKKLLRAVPTKFLQITSNIEKFGYLEKMTVEETVGSLKEHEECLKRPTDSDNKANGGDSRTKEWNRGTRDKSKVRCFNCLAYGHYVADCCKPKRDKEQRLESNLILTHDDEPALLMMKRVEEKVLLDEENVKPKLVFDINDKTGGSNVWYLDNGASNHMAGEISKFNELDEKVTGKVHFGDGSTVDIKGKGLVLFRCKNGEERLFHEVYYIPTLCNNILSLRQFSEEGNRVVMYGEFLWVYDKEKTLLMKVRRSDNRLHKILIESVESKCLMSTTEEVSWNWHSRLDHVNFQALSMMSSHKMVESMPKLVQPKKVCQGCLMSKKVKEHSNSSKI